MQQFSVKVKKNIINLKINIFKLSVHSYWIKKNLHFSFKVIYKWVLPHGFGNKLMHPFKLTGDHIFLKNKSIGYKIKWLSESIRFKIMYLKIT